MRFPTTDRAPVDLAGAMCMLARCFSDEEVVKLRSGEIELVHMHHGLGQWIRNHWHLWDRDAPLPVWFRDSLMVGHADDISAIILESTVAAVRCERYDVSDRIASIHAHWARAGCDEFGEEIR